MKVKNISMGVLATIVVVVVLNKFIAKDEPVAEVEVDKLQIYLDFNNSEFECSNDVPIENGQRYWDYIQSKSNEDDRSGLGMAYYRLGKTYMAMAVLLHNIHLDLYDKPVNDYANPALPITPTLDPNKTAIRHLQREKTVFNRSKPPSQKWTRDVYDLYFHLQKSDKSFFINRLANEISIRTFGSYQLHHPEKILMIGYWCLEKSFELLKKELSESDGSTNEQYRNWLAIVDLSTYFEVDWKGIPNNERYSASIMDSLASPAIEISMILDVIPQLVESGIISPNDVVKALSSEDIDFEFPELLVNLIMAANSGASSEKEISIPRNIDDSEFSFLGPKVVLLAGEYLYEKGRYQEGMYILSRFWYESTEKHPMKYWCFDNYPEFLLRSYKIARWDGGRLPLFNGDFSKIMGNDPVLRSALELLQIYIGVIANSITSESDVI